LKEKMQRGEVASFDHRVTGPHYRDRRYRQERSVNSGLPHLQYRDFPVADAVAARGVYATRQDGQRPGYRQACLTNP
jgi:hypothetical protein